MVSEVAELDPVLSAFVRAHVGDPIAVEVVTGDHEDADVWRIEAPDGRRCYLKRPHHAGLVGRERNAYIALAPWLGILGFVGVIVWLYGWMLRRSAAT